MRLLRELLAWASENIVLLIALDLIIGLLVAGVAVGLVPKPAQRETWTTVIDSPGLFGVPVLLAPCGPTCELSIVVLPSGSSVHCACLQER